MSGIEHETALALMDRLIEHRRQGTTDMASDQRREPISAYLDEGLWQREISEIFHRVPLPVAVSAELAEPGSYKAMRVAGREILLVRDKGGRLNAMLNVCRHRAMKLVPAGCGQARRFTCGYHSWTYDTDGALISVNAEDSFGPVNKADYSLTALACEERAGIIFVCLTAGLSMDIDSWLGGVLPHLEQLGLHETFHFSTRELAGPNWKVTADGYLEGYHFGSLHATTVARTNFSNMAIFDSFGPHIRNVFALREIDRFLDSPRDEWDPAASLGLTYWLFPGLAIAGGLRERTVVSIMLPGDTWGESLTRQSLLLRQEPATPEALAEAEYTADWFYEVFRDEDYTAQTDVQRGLASNPDGHMIIGRNEPAVQHLHQTLERLMGTKSKDMTPQLTA